MTEELYEEIIEEAYKRHRKANLGAQGQTLESYNFIEYWVAKVTWEFATCLDKN